MALPKTLPRVLTSLALASSLGLGGAWSLIDKYEPARGDMTKVYLDALGVPTVCRGATGAITKQRTITPADCDAQTITDLKVARATVQRCVSVPLTDGEVQAWTSFTYNVGPGGKRKDGFCMLKRGVPPQFIHDLQAGHHTAACSRLMDWTMPGTKVHNGLYARRMDELAMCLHDLPKGSP